MWHEGASDRVVLICDMWHPELDLARDLVPTLTQDEMVTLQAAKAGQHLPLSERSYTTGKTVSR